MTGFRPAVILLRDATRDDLPILYEYQLDPDATAMAAFPSRDWEAFTAHWSRILGDGANITKVVVADGQVAGSIASFEMNGRREVGYWFGREFWGKGIATRALAALLEHDATRPLHAHVAKHNTGSLRVLQKCGFVIIGEDTSPFGEPGSEPVEEFVLILRGDN